jgi:MFS family permease
MLTRRQTALIILTLWGAGLGAAAQFGKFAILFDRIAGHYPQASLAMLGLVVSIVGFVGLILGTTAGIFAQRLGYRRVLVVALGAGAVLSLLQASLPPLPVLLALRAAEGFSHLAIVVAAPVLIAQLASQRFQGFAMTLWSSFFAISFTLTAALGLPLVKAYGDGAMFLAHATYMAVFAGLLAWLLPRDTKPEPQALPSLLRQHAQIYASPWISAPAMGFFCYTLTYVALLTLLPPLFGAHQVFLATALPMISIAVSLTFGVWILKHRPAVQVAQGGFALAVAATMVLWLFWGQSLALIAALAIGAALGVVQGASFAAIPQLNRDPGNRARAAGAIAQLGNLGTTTGTPLLAVLIAGQGVGGLAAFVILPSLMGIAVHQLLNRRRRVIPE